MEDFLFDLLASFFVEFGRLGRVGKYRQWRVGQD